MRFVVTSVVATIYSACVFFLFLIGVLLRCSMVKVLIAPAVKCRKIAVFANRVFLNQRAFKIVLLNPYIFREPAVTLTFLPHLFVECRVTRHHSDDDHMTGR